MTKEEKQTSHPITDRFGPWAVVTGASSGIGAEFSRQLAAAGMNVVLIARRVDRLENLADEIRKKYSMQAKVVPADLTNPDIYKDILAATEHLDVGLLINNAGMSSMGSFLRNDIEYCQRLIAVNVTSVMSLAHAFARKFATRQNSGMIFVSSMLNQPSPYFAPYCSSKAFVTNLALTLRAELEKDGVEISVLEPSFVKSEMSDLAIEELDLSKLSTSVASTEDCVQQALIGFAKGTPRIIPGLSNRVMNFVGGLVPEALRVRLMGALFASAMNPDLLKYK